jgi:hypothetical protein
MGVCFEDLHDILNAENQCYEENYLEDKEEIKETPEQA